MPSQEYNNGQQVTDMVYYYVIHKRKVCMGNNIIDTIKTKFLAFLQNTYQLDTNTVNTCSITINTDAKSNAYGDINSNAPLVLAKQLGQKPIDLAEQIAHEFQHEHIAHVDAAKPGFVNITLTEHAYTEIAQSMYNNGSDYFTTPANNGPRYNLEFVSANPTGPLHFGHGRGGIIGDVLARILRFNQYHATREYYVNDAGQQMHKLGMSLYYRCRQAIGDTIELPEDAYHGEYLVELAQNLVTEHGKDVVNSTYQFFADYAHKHLLSHIQNTLSQYNITYDVWFSEQTLHDEGSVAHAIQTLTDKGYTYIDDGALWFTSTQFGDDKDRVLQRNNGDYTYVAADIAYLLNKFNRGFDQLIMILGQDHHSYVDRLKGATQALGYDPDRLYIILYQMVSLKDTGQHVRMSKRAGKIVSLDYIIDMVGTDAARYFYLNKKADAHLEFDIDLARKHSDENPVFYIQYAYVRTKSMLDKAAQSTDLQNISADNLHNLGQAERGLLRKIASLKPLLTNIQNNYQTHLLAHYVYDVATTFHSYYATNKVIIPDDPDTSRMRLATVQIVRNTIGICLDLLGLQQPDSM